MKQAKILMTAAMVLVVAWLAWAYWPQQTAPDNEVVPQPEVNVPDGWQAFQSGDISIAYPSAFSFIEALEPYYFLPNVMLSLYTDAASYQRMNYSQDGRIVVSSAELESDACYTPPDVGQSKTFDGVISLNGATWRTVSFSDAATGHRYETTVYRIPHKGMCYEVVSTLHYASDWTDIDMAAAEQSQKEMRELLQDVVETVTVK